MISSQTILGGVDLGINKPALVDSIIIDCVDCDDLPHRVEHVYAIINSRLTNIGMIDGAKIVFVAQYSVIRLFAGSYPFRLCKDRNVGNCAYLLTLSANGKQLIAPPLGMTWDDYLNSLSGWGDIKPLIFLAPWAQAKFINVEV